jgi:hypothetical protein
MTATITAAAFAALLSIMPPCPTEDSTNCGWDASKRGNGRGVSFVAIETTAGELLIYEEGKTP